MTKPPDSSPGSPAASRYDPLEIITDHSGADYFGGANNGGGTKEPGFTPYISPDSDAWQPQALRRFIETGPSAGRLAAIDPASRPLAVSGFLHQIHIAHNRRLRDEGRTPLAVLPPVLVRTNIRLLASIASAGMADPDPVYSWDMLADNERRFSWHYPQITRARRLAERLRSDHDPLATDTSQVIGAYMLSAYAITERV